MPIPTQKYTQKITQKLRKMRRRAKVSQKGAAAFFGSNNVDFIGEWERGISGPNPTRRSDIIRYLCALLQLREIELKEVWDAVMIGEWKWEKLSDEELHQYVHKITLSSASVMLTSDIKPVPAHYVKIDADLNYSAITTQAYRWIQNNIAPGWTAGNHSDWPGLAPQAIEEAFETKNHERGKDASRKVRVETAVTPLVRLIAHPDMQPNGLHLLVAPISWDLYSVRIPYPSQILEDKLQGRYVPSEQLFHIHKEFMDAFPNHHPANAALTNPVIGPRNFVPLGLEALVVTTDNFALLRLKDATTTVGGGEWDISFSGYARFDTDYCVDQPLDHRNTRFFPLILDRWLTREFLRETGVEEGNLNLEKTWVFGVHQNKTSGATDILVYVRARCSAAEIAERLYIDAQLAEEAQTALRQGNLWSEEYRYQRKRELLARFRQFMFLDKSRGPIEREVAETGNLFVPFTPDEIEKFFIEVVDKKQTILPEAQRLILGALQVEHGVLPISLVNKSIGHTSQKAS